MREGYKQSLIKMGKNPKNFEISELPEGLVAIWDFLVWTFTPVGHTKSDKRGTAYLHRYMYYYAGKLFKGF